MSKISLTPNANGTGTFTIASPNSNSDRILNLPDSTGTVATLGTSLTLATAVTASGTSVDFTGIPSWAKRITVLFSGVSTNNVSHVMVQIGDAGGIETTGYSSAGRISGSGGTVAGVSSTAGFIMFGNAAPAVSDGELTINKLSTSGTSWVSNHLIANPPAIFAGYGSGTKTLSDTLTQVRITTVNGTDAFDAGTLNIMYEG